MQNIGKDILLIVPTLLMVLLDPLHHLHSQGVVVLGVRHNLVSLLILLGHQQVCRMILEGGRALSPPREVREDDLLFVHSVLVVLVVVDDHGHHHPQTNENAAPEAWIQDRDQEIGQDEHGEGQHSEDDRE